ncbi:hypothetical protein BgiMline_008534 [Biomphalaria glabrata]
MRLSMRQHTQTHKEVLRGQVYALDMYHFRECVFHLSDKSLNECWFVHKSSSNAAAQVDWLTAGTLDVTLCPWLYSDTSAPDRVTSLGQSLFTDVEGGLC